MCELAAAELSIDPNEVIVASTGVIGQVLPIEPIESHIKELAKGLSADGNDKAVNAIMTTDTVPKQYAVKFMLGDSECTVGGMAKGSGMIQPEHGYYLKLYHIRCCHLIGAHPEGPERDCKGYLQLLKH